MKCFICKATITSSRYVWSPNLMRLCSACRYAILEDDSDECTTSGSDNNSDYNYDDDDYDDDDVYDNNSNTSLPDRNLAVGEAAPTTSDQKGSNSYRLVDYDSSSESAISSDDEGGEDRTKQSATSIPAADLIEETRKYVRKFKTHGLEIKFLIKPSPTGTDHLLWFKQGFKEIFDRIITDSSADDLVGFTITGESFIDRTAWQDFKMARELVYDDMWNALFKIMQSNGSCDSKDTFTIKVTRVTLPSGSGPTRAHHYITTDEFIAKKRSIIEIKNKDNNCLPRALVVARARHELTQVEFAKVRKNYGRAQDRLMEELLLAADVSVPSDGCSLRELEKFQCYLSAYQIVVYNSTDRGRSRTYQGPEKERKLNLLIHNRHYHVITSLTGAFACGGFCESCYTPYDHNHRCQKACRACRKSPACEQVSYVKCTDCKRTFRSEGCYNRHKEGLPNTCNVIKKCDKCFSNYSASRVHSCGEYFCVVCSCMVEVDHLCYIQKDVRQPPLKKILFIFFDLESMQEKVVGSKNINGVEKAIKLHQPNLCCFQQRCSDCISDSEIHICAVCGVRSNIIKVNVIDNFLEYVLNCGTRFRQVIVISHNGGRYDNVFILKALFSRPDLKPEVIMRGNRIIVLQVGRVKFLDSLNYFAMPLSAFSKAFDLQCVKGYFPHLFNTTENQNCDLPSLPPPEFYSPDSMKPEERVKFIDWYKTHKNDRFNLRSELERYCLGDVVLLREACLKFRQLYLEEANICCFTEAVTLAGTTNLVFRRNFLTENTIAVIPKNGYRLCNKQSATALKWLISEQRKLPPGDKIIHAGVDKEKKIGRYRVDGFLQKNNGEPATIYEFLGCWFHGCPKCQRYSRDAPIIVSNPSDTMDSRYEKTLERNSFLKSLGYLLIEKWECDFRKESSNPDYLSLTTAENNSILKAVALNPRDALYGGRTGPTRTYAKCRAGEKIKYYDFTSLYPYINKTSAYPIGHPKVHVATACNEVNLNQISGLIKCKILPPSGLYHPLLPIHAHNKLLFVLCKACALVRSQSDGCCHSVEEKALEGTWVVEEVQKALVLGYRILEIYEIWEYSVQAYDGDSNEGLFTGMMNYFLKMKQEASGYPSNVQTEEEKISYIREFFEHEKIHLDPSKIKKNVNQRHLAKSTVNNFWGRFAMAPNKEKVAIISKADEYFNLLTAPDKVIHNVVPINEEIILVNWSYKDIELDFNKTTNVVIAAYTTALARLKLYEVLELLGERILYYDTDSAIFITSEKYANIDPVPGNFIGELTDEISSVYGEGSYIEEYCSGGPKNYALKIYIPSDPPKYDTVVKVKGIRLNYEASEVISFDSIKNIILSDETGCLSVSLDSIVRNKAQEVLTVPAIKRYRVITDKRKFDNLYNSVPYGYKHLKKK